jgi:serine/threonine protein kinase
MKELEQKNIMRIVATSINLPKNIYICTEFMNNNSLLNFLKIEKNQNKFIIVRILRQITSALLYLIQNNIIHRDLRCKNIFLGNNCLVKLGNFGLARKLDNNKVYQIRSNIKESKLFIHFFHFSICLK